MVSRNRNTSRNTLRIVPFAYSVEEVAEIGGWVCGWARGLADGPWPTILDALRYTDHIGYTSRPSVDDQLEPLFGIELPPAEPDPSFPLQRIDILAAINGWVREPRADEFIRKFGLLRTGDFEAPPQNAPRDVRRLWKAPARVSSRPFALPVEAFVREGRQLRELVSFNKLVTTPDVELQDREAAFHRAEALGYHSPEFALEASVMQNMRGVTMGVTWRLEPFIATECVTQAVYVFLWRMLSERSPVRVCERANCGTTFISSRASRRYCSGACEEAAKQKRYNDRKRAARLG